MDVVLTRINDKTTLNQKLLKDRDALGAIPRGK